MANEAQIRASLQIKKGSLVYQSQPTGFVADVTGTFGPSPGAILATTQGVQVDFSALTVPGLCRLMNLDDTNFVEWGIYDPETLAFFPLGEILPGESYVIRLSRNLQEQYYGTGTGTSAGGETNRLMIKAHSASCNVLVEAFEA